MITTNGFQRGYSREKARVDVIQTIDTLDPKILCEKLNAVDKRYPVNSWIHSKVSHRPFPF